MTDQPSDARTGDAPNSVVGIGASAGGLEALRALVSHLSDARHLAILIAQHLSPQHRSLMTELLGRETTLPVAEVVDDLPLAANTIYICPPNKDLTIDQGRLRLRTPQRSIGPKPSVDVLFQSLADSFGKHAVGIILSGTGSDGAHGARAIRAVGGLTIAQTPDSAQYDSMPQAAIHQGGADLVMPPAEIGAQLGDLVRMHRESPAETGAVSDIRSGPLGEIIDAIWKRQKLDFSRYKDSTVRRQVDRRIAANQLDSLEEYAAFTAENPEELEALAKSFLISVTAFFRDRKSFDALAETLQGLISGKENDQPIRIWVPGCATGEEPYSLSILVHELMVSLGVKYPLQIFATDIDVAATNYARRGVYPEAALQEVDDELIKRYFSPCGDGYLVDKRIMESVIFARQDLIRDPPFLRLDLISCRNVLIYFKADLQEHLFRVFHYALNPAGVLFLGQSEVVTGAAGLFFESRRGKRIFERNDLAHASPLELRMYRPNLEFTKPPAAAAKRAPPEPQAKLREQLLRQYAPAGILVDGANQLLEIFGDTREFLHLNEGSAKLDCVALIRDDLRVELRALLHRARSVARPQCRGRPFHTASGDFQIRATIVEGLCDAEPAVMLTFEPVQGTNATDEDGGSDTAFDPTEASVRHLEEELAATREHLHVVIEELETSNEELQSLNEELQASGEELQAANEELATSNEELQAANEELSTVNDELQFKTNNVIEALAELGDIQDAIPAALVVVDRDFLVTRFNAQAVRMIGLTDSDIGRNFTALPIRLQIPDLHARMTAALGGEIPTAAEVLDGDEAYRIDIRPYLNHHDRPGGVLMTLADISDVKRTEVALQRTQHLFSTLTEHHDVAFWIQDVPTGRMVYVSPGHERLYGIDTASLRQDPDLLSTVMIKADGERYRRVLSDAHGHACSMRIRIVHPQLGGLRWLFTRICVTLENGLPRFRTGVTIDVTDDIGQYGSEENLGLVLDTLLDAANDSVLGIDEHGQVSFANLHACELLGLDTGQLRQMPASNLLDAESAGELDKALALVASCRKDRTASRLSMTAFVRIRGGESVRSDILITTDPIMQGPRSRAVVIIRAPDTRSTGGPDLALASGAFNNAPDGIILLSRETRVLAANLAAQRILAKEPQDLLGHIPTLFHSGNPNSAFTESMWRSLESINRWTGEVHLQRATEGFAVLDITVVRLSPCHGEDPGRYLVSITDVTATHSNEASLYQHANLDMLTGLPNRRVMLERLEQELKRAEREGYGVTLMFVDLDRFKEVNDSLGHEAGDILLVEASRRIRATVRASDTVARFGGDEFVVLLPKYQRQQAPELTARMLVQRLEEAFEINGQKIYLSASIGIAVYPQDGVDTAELLRNADLAMYKAKEAGRRGFAFYQPELNRDAVRRMALEAELVQAIENRELQVYYQPIVDVTSRRISELEALVRWQHPRRGLLLPAQFVPYAENAGLIDDITEFVFDQARRDLSDWRRDYDPQIRVSINLCARQFRGESFERLFRNTGQDLRGFVFELTESALDGGIDKYVNDSLHWLRDNGALVAIDDFGTGHSSLSHVHRFPVDIIKIGREFVVESVNNPRDAALIAAVVTMAHGIEARVVAEGVDSERQARLMEKLDVDGIQGFFYSEPLPAHDAISYMQQRAALIHSDAAIAPPG